jgi:FkbM family methyltransferase
MRQLKSLIVKVLRRLQRLSESARSRFTRWENTLLTQDFDAKGRIYRINDQTFEVPGLPLVDDEFAIRFVRGGYESKEEYELVAAFIKPQLGILELGGCLGVMSCFANARIDSPHRHVVLEANPDLLPFLNSNCRRNGCGYEALNRVMSNDESVVFYKHDLIVGGSCKRQTQSSVTVSGIKLEELIPRVGLPYNLIVDIEGGELDLLRNQFSLFENAETVFIELHPFASILTQPEAAECECLLFKKGFIKRSSDVAGTYQVWTRE